ncbi:MAG TPA: hypothetical protein DD379_00445 [Cyanobacteria bacterium UBA11162]|nr:hypothetical protein [Cyanobacteria bacterium UBA11162]
MSEVDGGSDGDNPNNGIVNNIPVTVDPGETDSGNNFVDERRGNISGSVTDQDGNPLGGVSITLVDSNGNPVGSPIQTNPDGTYQFNNVAPGNYNVIETNLPNYGDVSEVDGGDDSDNPDNGIVNNIPVTVDPGEADTGNDFVDFLFQPSIDLIKTAGNAADGTTLTTLAGNVTYTYKVSNTGNVALTNVTVVDDNGTAGDTSDDFTVGTISSLGVGAMETLTATRNITVDTTNLATATGTTPTNGTVDDTDDAVVDVIAPAINLIKTAGSAADGTILQTTAGNVTYTYKVTNIGDTTLTNVTVVDDNGTAGDTSDDFTVGTISSLGVGAMETLTATRNITADTTNIATATGTTPLGGTVNDTDDAVVDVIPPPIDAPGVRTPGFWGADKWQKFWDGIQGNEPSQAGQANFPTGDLFYSPYTNSAQPGKVLDPVTGTYQTGVLIGDYNRNGMTDGGENTLFYTTAQAVQIINASNNVQGSDKRYTLDRSLVASWLNYLAGNPIDTANPTDKDVRYYINEAIDWLQALTPDQNSNGKGDGYLHGLTGNETPNSQTPQIPASSAYWNSGITSASGLPSPYNSNTNVLYPIDAGNTIHTALDNYNNTGAGADGAFPGG